MATKKPAAKKTAPKKKPTTKKKPAAKSDKGEFDAVFARLKAMFQKYQPPLVEKKYRPEFFLLMPKEQKGQREIWFGGVRFGKAYISCYLPCHGRPDIEKVISPALKKRRQGKGCFNFTSIDDELFVELEQLTKACFERFRQDGFV
ncbi:MAG TPA: hypothetical protein VKS79_23190 [Gemmataceae bacterium]|nr:hypothetical protein [Gemmataceae bacterium]